MINDLWSVSRTSGSRFHRSFLSSFSFSFFSFRQGEPVREKGRDERASVSGGDISLDRPFDCPSWRATDISDREVCNSIVLFIVQSSVNRDASSRRILSIILTLVLATFSCAKERQRESIYIYIFRRSLNIRTCTRFTIREHLLESSITASTV